MSGLLNLSNSNEMIEVAKRLIKEIYLENDTPWVVGYSGGKDSTVVCQLVFDALMELDREQLTKTVYIISSDTMVETPPVIKQIQDNLNQMQETAKNESLPIETHIVKPLPDQGFWANIIGRGYPSPNQTFRWCTDRMKIDPANRFIKQTVSEFGKAIMVLGIREGESASRDRVISEHSIEGKKLMRHTTLNNAYVFAPIRPFNVDDVWNYLLNSESPWGADNNKLYELYADSSSTECPLVVDEATKERTGSCGNSRFGCWTCTVVEEDKALTGFIENGEDWLRPLLRFRNWLASIRDDRTRRMKMRTSGNIYFSPIIALDDKFVIPKKSKRDKLVIKKSGEGYYDNLGHKWHVFEDKSVAQKYIKKNNIDLTSSYDPKIIAKINGDGTYGQLGLGPFTMEAREEILRGLLRLQKQIEKDFTLIGEDELFEIRKIWLENADMEDRVQQLYEEIMEKPLDWETDDIPLLDESQLAEIRTLCEQYGIDFNVYKKLVNVQKKHLGNWMRKKPLQEIERLLNMDYLHVGE